MRQEILNWNREKGGKSWEPFLKFFETSPVTQEEYDFILKKEKENFINHSESHFNPARKCLNSIYNKDKFVEQDLKKNLKEIDEDFLSGKKINFKDFLTRIEKYPMSEETLNKLIKSPNTTGDYNKYKQNIIKQSKIILEIANKLHKQEKLYFSVDKVVSDFEKEITKSIKDNPSIRKNRLNQASKIPEKIQMTAVGFKRNPDVVAEVLLRANGVCEQCNKNAPFIRKKDNTPYLEVHHRLMLSDGGEDTVKNAIAICPNCHRELHFGI
jgi:5-methylcytosine-specific restriction protein A